MHENAYLMFLELNEASAEDVEIEDALYFVLEHYQRQGIAIDYDEMNMDSVRIILILYCSVLTVNNSLCGSTGNYSKRRKLRN